MVETEALPYVAECESCTQLQLVEQDARADMNPSREADYRVLARRHLRIVHGVTVKVSQ